jgi:thiol:disulfide interchange protein/DsbC/DsbD-like thiol-disulfide interchange protein
MSMPHTHAFAMRLFRLLTLCLLLALSPVGAWAQWTANNPAVAQSERTRAQLMVYAPNGVQAGQPMWLGIELDHSPDWHTYWVNSGDSGLPTDIQWQLPAGLQAQPLQWPTPKKFTLGPLANYGYDGRVLLSSPLTVSATPSGKTVRIGVDANWLACRTECVPETAHLELDVLVDGPSTDHQAAFTDAEARLPRDLALRSTMHIEGDQLVLKIEGVPAPWQGQDLEVYPEITGLIVPGAEWLRQWDGTGLRASLPLNPDREASPSEVAWVLAVSPPEHGLPAQAGARVVATMASEWPAVVAPELSPALQAALAAQVVDAAATTQTPSASWLSSLLLALVGGLLLNLMPCVFPVLAIKVLAFSQNDNVRIHRASGLAYTAGVVASFVALAALLLTLRAAGEAVGWGFQLQNPSVVAGLAVLFTLIGLNLAGLFELNQLFAGQVAGLRFRHPVADAAWSGVLATAVASPCTAPFMGAALGLAISLPTAQALTLFGAVGLGMALPYLAIAWIPAAARLLPGPGAWMLTFKHLMAFPMFATVVWLVWVLGQQSGINGAAALLLLLVATALVLWVWGLSGKHIAWWRALVGAGLVATALTLWPYVSTQREQAPQASAGWQVWTPELQASARAQGRAVFVDFTAAWCVTCQVNELGAMRDARVLAAFEQGQWLRLRADWTRRDPAITQALNQVQRTGVPTYVVYHPQGAPMVLSELLTAQQLLSALAPR